MALATQTEYATGVGESRKELTALIAGCGVYQADKSLFSLTGRDRTRWLNGMVTNNVRDLATGNGVYAFVLNAQGNILGDLYVFNRGESLVVEIEREQAESVVQLLRRYIIMDKVEIEDLSGKMSVVGVTGPKSHEALAAIELNSDPGPLQAVVANDIRLTLVGGDNPCVPSYEIWAPPQDIQRVINELARAGAERVSERDLEAFRILCGVPKFGKDIKDRTLPHETGQERALSFTKGCYIGQEIVERIRARGAVHRTFTGFDIEGEPPAAGTKIQSEGKDVGEITSVLYAPFKSRRLGLGFLRKEHASSQELFAGGAKLRSVTLPLLTHAAEI